MSTRDRILSALAKFAPRPVTVPALDATVYVRPLTVAGMARIHGVSAEPFARHKRAQEALTTNPEDPALQAAERQAAQAVQRAHERTSTMMLLDCVVDEQGRPIFELGDEERIAALPSQVAETLLVAIDEVAAIRSESSGDAAGN